MPFGKAQCVVGSWFIAQRTGFRFRNGRYGGWVDPATAEDATSRGPGYAGRPWQRWVSLVCRLCLAAVFGVSGAIKAADPNGTQIAVRAYSLLPDGLVGPVAVALPWFELALALLFLVGLATRLASILAALTLVAFIAGVLSAAARGLSIDCGCFGGGGQVEPGATRYAQEVLRDVGFLLMAGWLIWRPMSPLSVDRWAQHAQA